MRTRSFLFPCLLLSALLTLSACGSAPVGPDVKRLCTALVACGVEPAATNAIANCVRRMVATGATISIDDQRINQCYLSSSSCDLARSCVSRSHSGAYCASHRGRSCDGDLLVDCTPEPAQAVDCARLGQRCRQATATEATCTNTGATCMGSQDICMGNVHFQCRNGFQSAVDCELILAGSQCVASGMTAQCLPNTPECTPSTFEQHCDGNTAVICSAAVGRESRAVCPTGTNCVVTDHHAVCAAPMVACAENEADSCDGANIRYCAFGQRVTLPCDVVGTTMCATMMGHAICQ